MARARNLKPSFFTNEVLAEINPLGRLLFQGLWCHADKEGRLEDRPKKLKAEILPYDNCDADALLSELDERGFILRYSIGQGKYIQILTFTKHQNPHIKEAASSIPAPQEHSACTVLVECEHRESMEEALELHESSPASNGFLLPSNGFPQPYTCASADAEREPELPKAFVSFWETYPRKKAKGSALKAWKKLKPSERLAGEILQAVQRAKTSTDWMKSGGEFIPYPASWLNSRGWEDEINTSQQTDATDNRPHAPVWQGRRP